MAWKYRTFRDCDKSIWNFYTIQWASLTCTTYIVCSLSSFKNIYCINIDYIIYFALIYINMKRKLLIYFNLLPTFSIQFYIIMNIIAMYLICRRLWRVIYNPNKYNKSSSFYCFGFQFIQIKPYDIWVLLPLTRIDSFFTLLLTKTNN